MGTNFYLQKPDSNICPHCHRRDEGERLHIGKSSAGWCFALHVHPENGINTLDDWRNLWSAQGNFIIDEYGDRVSIDDMELRITVRSTEKDFDSDKLWWFRSYRSEQEFHSSNYSERGPNGLLRRRVDGIHCIGHGEGTYDYITGDFS